MKRQRKQQHDEPDDQVADLNFLKKLFQSFDSHSNVCPNLPCSPICMSLVGLERPVAFDAEGQAIHFAIRGDDHAAVIVEAQADQPDAKAKDGPAPESTAPAGTDEKSGEPSSPTS